MNKKLKHFGLGVLSGFTLMILLLLLITVIPSGNITNKPSKIAIIPVNGEIIQSSGNKPFPTSNPDTFEDLIKKADSDPSIGAIVLEINSNGGNLVAAEQMVESINKTNKPIVAWIGNNGTSVAYYVATGTDEIIADRGSIVGGIGVLLTLETLTQYYDKIGEDIYSATGEKYKEIGENYTNLTSKEKNDIQKIIYEENNYLISLIAENRNLSESSVKTMANEKMYTGTSALNSKLVDEVGGKEYAISKAAKMAGMKKFETIELGIENEVLDALNSFFSNLYVLIKKSFENFSNSIVKND